MRAIVQVLVFVVVAGMACVFGQEAGPTPAQLAEAYYQRGVAREKAGDYAAAWTAYRNALKQNPNHAQARYRLREMELNKKAIAEAMRKGAWDKLILPELRLDGASLPEALDALAAAVGKASKGKLTPNPVVQDPENKLETAKVTLNLRNIPASAALKYVVEQAGAKVRFDEHAVVITPK